MTVVNQTATQIWLQIVKNQDKINLFLVVFLAVFLLAYAADLTWRLWPMPNSHNSAQTSFTPRIPTTNTQNSSVNLAPIKRLNLFGDYNAQPVVEETVTDAPITQLNLTLTGVVSSSNQDEGAAIIENRNQQQTYGVGEKIDATNATLKEVYADRVIIKNGLSNETLMLDGVDYKKTTSQPTQNNQTPLSTRVSGPQRITLSDDAMEASLELQDKPASFVDYIAVSPHRPDGELKGYRVSPGKKPALFQSAGLQAGDVITEINGLDLTDIQQAMEAMNMLKELRSLQMSVERQDEILTIYLDLPEGEEEPET